MRNLLPEYFQPTEEEIKRIWQHGTIVIDANVLLNLFRYSENSRSELIKILQYYSKRLWIPYQVAFEFLENSVTVPAHLNSVLHDTLKKIDEIQGVLEKHLNLNQFDKYHLLKPDEIRKDIKKIQDRLHEKVEKINKEYEKVDKKSIVEQISTLLEGKVGNDFDEKTLLDSFREGERRYKEKIPPGYKDLESKKANAKRHLYGDYLWWMQAIEYSAKNHCDLIIVTDDAKEDWWFKVGSETVGPRVELIKEFRNKTNQTFHMYRTARFMELAKKYDKVTVSNDSIKEVKSTSAIDYSNLFEINKQPWLVSGVNGKVNPYNSILNQRIFDPKSYYPEIDKPDYEEFIKPHSLTAELKSSLDFGKIDNNQLSFLGLDSVKDTSSLSGIANSSVYNTLDFLSNKEEKK